MFPFLFHSFVRVSSPFIWLVHTESLGSICFRVATIYTGVNGYLDVLETSQVKKFLIQLCEYLMTNKLQFTEIVCSTKNFTEQTKNILKEFLNIPYEKRFK